MICFLTSNPGGSYREGEVRKPCAFSNSNGFRNRIKKYWMDHAKGLLVASDPENYIMNDHMKKIFQTAFSMTQLPVSQIDICDNRKDEIRLKQLKEYDFLILSGGHVPTQNLFFHKIELAKHMQNYGGIVIGISAGTMNCAKTVYAPPELLEEIEDPFYKKYLTGLGLTNIQVIPHYNEIRMEILAGKRVLEDVIVPDSINQKFVALEDGSYIQIENGRSELFGKGYFIANQEIKEIGGENQSVLL